VSVPPFLRRLLIWLISLPLLLLLLILLAAGIAISTKTGIHTLLGLAPRILPGQLSYDRIDGRLLGPLHIERFRYEDGPLKVALASADLDWKPADLFSGTLNLLQLRFDGLTPIRRLGTTTTAEQARIGAGDRTVDSARYPAPSRDRCR